MKKWLAILNKTKLFIVFILFFAIASLTSEYFLSWSNMNNLLIQVAAYGIVACGMTFAVISGEFDISVGSVMVLAGVMGIALINTLGWWAAIIAWLLLTLFVGVGYTFLCVKLGMSSFIATLGGSVFYRGLAYVITGDGTPIRPLGKAYTQLANLSVVTIKGLDRIPIKIHMLVVVFFVCVLICQFIQKRTSFGRRIYATGCDYEVAKAAGINVVFYKGASFTLCALFSVLGGILMTSRLNVAAPNAAEDAGMTALSAVVLGGASLDGGTGSAFGTFMGVMILGLITNALNMMGINSYIQLAVKGALLILFVSMERFFKNQKA